MVECVVIWSSREEVRVGLVRREGYWCFSCRIQIVALPTGNFWGSAIGWIKGRTRLKEEAASANARDKHL